jgi:transposase-like protein
MAVGPAETEAFWTEFLRSLVRRGLSGVRLVVSDAHEGLKQAIAKVIGATWQRCRVHFMRNALAHVPRKQHSMVAAVIRTAFVQENQQEARQQWRETADKLRERFAKVAELMDSAEGRRACLHELPERALASAGIDEFPGAIEQGNQTPLAGGGYLPEQRCHHAARGNATR